MEGKHLIEEIAKCVPIAHTECNADLDLNSQRTGSGDQYWHHEGLQKYTGQFLQDSLHGRGIYSWTTNSDQVVYEGQFYASDLEGYGKFSYNDSSLFEGLFKGNVRFGPGVFTYPDGNQDVGMWCGKNLLRLCRVVHPEWVPRLAKTPTAKTKLLKFKRLVNVFNASRDQSKEILKLLEANKDVINNSDKLYNIYIRNPKSHFFNTPLYDQQYFCEKDCYIEVALSPEEVQSYNEKQMLEKSEQLSQESSRSGSGPLVTTVDYGCVCSDPKQIRKDEITLELEHLEKVLTRMRNEIKEAQCRKKLAVRIMEADNVRKSVAWEKIEVIGGDTIAIEISSHEKELELTASYEEECELEEEEEINFETACRQLNAALNAEKLLLRKKKYLVDKLTYEKTSLNACENEIPQHPTKRILITDLLAWNNEETFVEMLRHVFLHRNFEKNLSYCVVDLLAGDRSQFRNAGIYEEDCTLFLKQCSEGNVTKAIDLLRKRDLNPDLCDAKGNTGVIYAAACDRTRIIKTLVNFGANVDIFNDECITPLGICISRYLAVQHHVTDWEAAFLKTTSVGLEEEQEVREWRPHVSLSSLSNILQFQTEKSVETLTYNRSGQFSRAKLDALSELFGSNLNVDRDRFVGSLSDIQTILWERKTSQVFQEAYFSKVVEETPQLYLLSTECVKPPPERKEKEKKGKKGKKGKKSKSPKSDKSSKKSEKLKKVKSFKDSRKVKSSAETSAPDQLDQVLSEVNLVNSEEVLRNNKLGAIHDTISTLLKYGANPNACEVPLPTLILAIFTKNCDLIKDLLGCKANPNITTLDENLTALHVLVSLPPCEEYVEIAKYLLHYSADPNCKASIHHWVEQKMELVAQRHLEEEDAGKTPLHLLSMRYDFVLDTNGYLNQMVPILMEHGGKVKMRYLGHTPLSLAVIRGNLQLVKTFLDTKRINPNQALGEKMGAPLTLYILKRYQNLLPDLTICQEIIQLLLEYKANPFEKIEDCGNVIDFMIKEHEEPAKIEKQKKGKKGKGKKKGKDKSKSSGSKKSGKKGKKDKKSKGGQRVQEEVKKLLMAAAKTVLEKHTKGYAVKYLCSFVEEEDFYDDVSANMAKFVTTDETVRLAQVLVHRGAIPIDPLTIYELMYDLIEFIINVNSQAIDTDEPASAFVDIHKMLENFEFSKIPKEQGKLNLLEPEAEDHSEKYNVCFHCYQKKDRHLFICPDCNLVYFCSQQCNILNNKEKDSPHKCATLSYDKQKEIYEEKLARAHHRQFTSEAMQELPELAGGKEWIQDEVDIICQKRPIEQNPSRRLHLTRKLRRFGQKSVFIEGLGTKKFKLDVLNDASGQQASQIAGQGIPSGRWCKERSDFLSRKLNVIEDAKKTQKYKMQITKDKMAKKQLKNLGGKFEDSKTELLPSDDKGKKEQAKLKHESRDKAHKGKGGEAVSDDGDEKQGRATKTKGNGSTSKVSKRKEEGKSKDGGKEKFGKTTEEKGGRSEDADYGKGGGRKETLEIDKVALGRAECKDFELGANQPAQYVPIPRGGKILELERRLPSKYQYFLEKINEYWPEFDLSMLFLPYACYSNGQLYYRFLSKKPVFMETHSNNYF